jgi:metallo-beta-lactamase family protein
MKLTFCGAAGTTTGSQHLLEINGQRILLDCGLYQGRRQESLERNRHFPFDPATLDAVILSHAHIDHSGNLPNLVKQGFKGNIYCTDATRDLCQVMLEDSAHIQESDAAWLTRHDKAHAEPLYMAVDAEKCLRQFVTFGYDRSRYICEGVRATFIDAGHILGSAQVILDLKDQASGQSKRLLFSGDVGRGKNELLNDPASAENVDYVLMESTYGGREHEATQGAHDQLRDILRHALKTKGKVIIPCFAVERTQQILVVLHQLFQDEQIPDVPVIVDSPLAVSATEIFRLHPECFNPEMYEDLFSKQNPFGFEGLSLVRAATESKKINQAKGAMIIIAASGMCEAGRVVHHLKNNLSKPETTVLFVGYCAENTLGAKIRAGNPVVNIHGEQIKVRANITALDSFSGHADHSELMDYFERMGGKKEKVWLVHGETTRSQALQAALQETYPDKRISCGVLGQTVDLLA